MVKAVKAVKPIRPIRGIGLIIIVVRRIGVGGQILVVDIGVISDSAIAHALDQILINR